MSGDRVDLSAVAELYTSSLREHGEVARGVGWKAPADHELRFERLTTVIEQGPTDFVVAYLGCGFGSLFEFLVATGRKPGLYRGYDISEEMLAAARRRVSSSDAVFVLGSRIDEPADDSFASGIFNVRLAASEDEWREHVIRSLDNMNEMSRCGFAFNLLTSYVDWRDDNLYYADPSFFFDLCKRRYSRFVSLSHDYPLWEWTISVRR
ncbi:MAG: class I SAM-dependent methyltransferase [Alphaproteobacteria bacterium]|nr:class I SAM-dependent methyltransferase [Alphaproteobacteria bacterium]